MDLDLKVFEKYLSVNLTALFSVCREFARNNESGSIVNFTSIYGLVSPQPKLYGGDEKNIAYGVSKAGVIQLTKHLAVHLAPNFRVNCIAPGGVSHTQDDGFRRRYAEFTPLRRMMDVQELFGIIEFLISDQSSYCTGSVYSVDGGWTAW
jgi:gluconate 5-dehydrogenase